MNSKPLSLTALIAALFMLLGGVAHASDTLMTPMKDMRIAAPIDLPDSNGQPFSLSDYEGKYVLVNFWAHWCGPCVKEFPAMQTLYDALKDDGFEIVAVHAGPPQGRVRPFLEKYNITFKTVLDANMSVGGWVVRALPMSYLVSPDGKLIYESLGPREWEIDKMQALITEHKLAKK